MAQTTTNPLTVDIELSATVLVNPGTRPDTPPTSPGPVNMTDTIDAAVFKGVAFPGGIIYVLTNGVIVAQLSTASDGSFDIRVRNLAPGTYTFSIKAEDAKGLTSKLLTFTVYISSGIATLVEGIVIPPTMSSDKTEVKKGEVITFFGSSVPGSEIRLSFQSDVELLRRAIANASGTWSYDLDTTLLTLGEYQAKGRSLISNNLSLYSNDLPFRIGNTTRMRGKGSSLSGFRKRCDLNDDGRVNLLDFSIMAYWYKRLGFPVKVDLNTDSKVNLTDLSILAYCWTG